MAADDPDTRAQDFEKRMRQQDAALREWHRRLNERFKIKLLIGLPAITVFLICIVALIDRGPQWSTTQIVGLQFAALAALMVSQIVNMWPAPEVRDWRSFPAE